MAWVSLPPLDGSGSLACVLAALELSRNTRTAAAAATDRSPTSTPATKSSAPDKYAPIPRGAGDVNAATYERTATDEAIIQAAWSLGRARGQRHGARC